MKNLVEGVGIKMEFHYVQLVNPRKILKSQTEDNSGIKKKNRYVNIDI